MYFGEKNKIPN